MAPLVHHQLVSITSNGNAVLHVIDTGGMINVPLFYVAGGNLQVLGNIESNNGTISAYYSFISNIGDVNLPNFTFASDTHSGMYTGGIGIVSIASSGNEALRIQDSKITAYAPLHITDGSVTNPSYSFASAYNLGLYKGGTNTLSVASNNTQVIDFKDDKVTSYQKIYNIDGSSSAPAYSFSSATNLGIYKNSANTLSITSNGTEVARFNSALNQCLFL